MVAASDDEVVSAFGCMFGKGWEDFGGQFGAGHLLGDCEEDEDVVEVLVVLCNENDVESGFLVLPF